LEGFYQFFDLLDTNKYQIDQEYHQKKLSGEAFFLSEAEKKIYRLIQKT
jgi:hypothetical protein